MKKSILLGSAAALVAVTGAQAADLPVVEPVDYVRVCDAFGAGFHYIPGTETCLKFSGRVRTEIGVRDTNDNDAVDASFLNSNFELVVNASSMTEIGMVVGQFAISGSNEGDVALGDAWITIGENILVGREVSRYDFGGGYGIYDGLYVDEGINQFTFIMPFGNGLSMTLGLEDGRDRRAKIAQYNGNVASTTLPTNNLITPTASYTLGGRLVIIEGRNLGTVAPQFPNAPGVSTTTIPLNGTTYIAGANIGQDAVYGGMEIPDVVASLRISQGWGSAQISGALHQIRSITSLTPQRAGADRILAIATNGGGSATTTLWSSTGPAAAIGGVLDEDFGWAIQAGVELNVGSMTKVKVVGAYADGAMHYIGGAGYYEAAVDFVSGNITDTMSGWYALASLNHAFSSAMNVSVMGAYHDFDKQAELWQVSANLEYEVVENLVVSLAGQYTDISTETNAMLGTTAADTDSWEAKLRIQRNF